MSEELGCLNATWRRGSLLTRVKENEIEPSLLNFQDFSSYLRVPTKSDSMPLMPLLHRSAFKDTYALRGSTTDDLPSLSVSW